VGNEFPLKNGGISEFVRWPVGEEDRGVEGASRVPSKGYRSAGPEQGGGIGFSCTPTALGFMGKIENRNPLGGETLGV